MLIMLARLHVLLAVIGVIFLFQSTARAQSVLIKGEDANSSLTITADNASLGAVLGRLGQKFDFHLVGEERISQNISGTYRGDLKTLLKRLLRNRNHMIVRSTAKRAGIRRVVVINNAVGSKTTRFAGKKAPPSSRNTLADQVRIRNILAWNALRKKARQKQNP